MILREAIRQVRGFRYMIEQLDICSAVGRRVLYDLPWLDSKSRLEAEFERIQKIMVLFEQPENESRLERLTDAGERYPGDDRADGDGASVG